MFYRFIADFYLNRSDGFALTGQIAILLSLHLMNSIIRLSLFCIKKSSDLERREREGADGDIKLILQIEQVNENIIFRLN